MDALLKEHISIEMESLTANQKQTENKMTIPTYFHQNVRKDNTITKQDAAKVNKIVQQKPSTEQEVIVAKYVKLWKQADNAGDFPKERKLLIQYQQKIDKLKKEIASLNEAILDQLYPIEDLKLSDAKAVKEITSRYKAIPIYDRKQIVQHEDIEKAELQIKGLQRQRIISIVLVLIAIALGMFFIFKKRRRRNDES